jgi:hypothetical protein
MPEILSGGRASPTAHASTKLGYTGLNHAHCSATKTTSINAKIAPDPIAKSSSIARKRKRLLTGCGFNEHSYAEQRGSVWLAELRQRVALRALEADGVQAYPAVVQELPCLFHSDLNRRANGI